MPAHPPELTIRNASPGDAALILEFIRAIADYEKLSHQVVAGVEDIRRALDGNPPQVEVLLAEWNGQAAGFALIYANFSTFTGRAGIHLEDLFVHPEFRGCGIGRILFHEVARLAHSRGCPRVEWVALDWNKPALDFYRAHNATELAEWCLFRLEGPALQEAAGLR